MMKKVLCCKILDSRLEINNEERKNGGRTDRVEEGEPPEVLDLRDEQLRAGGGGIISVRKVRLLWIGTKITGVPRL